MSVGLLELPAVSRSLPSTVLPLRDHHGTSSTGPFSSSSSASRLRFSPTAANDASSGSGASPMDWRNSALRFIFSSRTRSCSLTPLRLRSCTGTTLAPPFLLPASPPTRALLLPFLRTNSSLNSKFSCTDANIRTLLRFHSCSSAFNSGTVQLFLSLSVYNESALVTNSAAARPAPAAVDDIGSVCVNSNNSGLS